MGILNKNRPYIYGKLNEEVQNNDYKGENTDTAEVLVDNETNTIRVNVIAPPITGTDGNLTKINDGKIIDSEIPASAITQLQQDVGNKVDNDTIASTTTLGLVKRKSGYGILIDNTTGEITLRSANAQGIKYSSQQGDSQYGVIDTSNLQTAIENKYILQLVDYYGEEFQSGIYPAEELEDSWAFKSHASPGQIIVSAEIPYDPETGDPIQPTSATVYVGIGADPSGTTDQHGFLKFENIPIVWFDPVSE